MPGLHLTADLEGCDPQSAPMTDADALRTLCVDAASAAGLRVVGERFHAFGAPGGVTGVLLLAESHLAVHTWPEFGSATVDVFVCNVGADHRSRGEAALAAIAQGFGPARQHRQRLGRGPGISAALDRRATTGLDDAERLRSAMDAAAIAFMLFGPDDRLVFASRAMCALYGVDESLLQAGRSFESIVRDMLAHGVVRVPAEQHPGWVAERMRLHDEGGSTIRRMPDGRWRRITEERLADGSHLSYSLDITEIVEQRGEPEAARDTARRAEQRLRDVIEALPVGLSLFDADDRLLMSNQRLRELHPAIADLLAAPGSTFEDLVRANYARGGLSFAAASDFEAHLARRLASRRQIGDRVTFRTPTHWIVPIEHRNRDGSVLGIQVDVTELVEQRRAAELAQAALQSTIAELGAARAELEQLSQTDALTGLANRRRLDAQLRADWARTARLRQPFSLLMIDVDHFKRFNDRQGHPAGDRCLQQVAEVLAATVSREIDLVARYGGEEFVIVLPHTDVVGAALVATACLEAVDASGIPHQDSPEGKITLSIGVACAADPSQGGSAEALLAAADAALLAAKRAGRHRIVQAPAG